MARTILVSVSDAKFFHLLDDMLASVEEAARRDGLDFGVLDVGLTPEQRSALEKWGVLLREPGMDYPPEIFRIQPERAFRAQTARPHLPRYFPGYEMYLFLDADCWVQNWEAVRLYLSVAEVAGLAATPECHRSYAPIYDSLSISEWRLQAYLKCFDESTAKTLSNFDLINCGVFAARADSKLWETWPAVLGNILTRVSQAYFYAEQNAFNALIRSRIVPAALLPAGCNWMCNRSTPMTREGGTVLCEPEPPHAPLGIVHITGPDKDRLAELVDVDGTKRSRSLRYRPNSPAQPI